MRSLAVAPVVLPVATALLLGAAYLAAPPMGTDLAAQVARTTFFAEHGWAALDFGWYGGVSPYGYSLVSPQLMAWLGGGELGPRVLGVLAAVLSTVALSALLIRTGAARPVLGGVLGAGCFYGNLASGRTTYALGVAVGLLALLAVGHRRRWWRAGGTVAGAALAAATSPVAGLFVGLAGAAWALSGVGTAKTRATSDRYPGASRLTGGALLMAGAAVPMVAMAVLFGAGGWMNISRWDTARAAGAGLVVALLVPRPAVRIGALLSTGGVLVAYAVHTPVGLNATRLAAMFALPVLAGYARLSWPSAVRIRWPSAARLPWPSAARLRWPSAARTAPVRALRLRAGCLAVVLAGVALWQPPVMTGDLRAAGDPAARSGYFAALRTELARRSPAGRVEVVPLANYGDAAFVPPAAPLARGWLRQADLAHNPLFFDGSLTAPEYERWLRDNGVAYVAVADAAPSWVGRAEAALIRAGLPYLTETWRDAHWTLYEVAGKPSIVEGARVVESTRSAVTVDAPPGEVLVRLRWSRWLSVREVPSPDPGTGAGAAVGGGVSADGACLARRGTWVTLRVYRQGRYELTGSLVGSGPFCPDSAG